MAIQHKIFAFIFLWLVLLLSGCASSKYNHLGKGTRASLSSKNVDNSGTKDVTKIIQEIINRFDTVVIDQGTYKVKSLILREGSTIIGEGPDSKFIQDRNVYELPVIWIIDSDATVKNIAIEGRIVNQKSEFNHGISVQSLFNDVRNISLSGITANNMRGDGIYIGSRKKRYNCYGIRVENIKTENCYRNGISITSGKDILIDGVVTKQSGLYGIDIEGDPLSVPINDITINNTSVSRIGIIGGGAKAQNINFYNTSIDGLLLGSNPKYSSIPNQKPGILFMGASNVTFKKTVITNTESYAIGSNIVPMHGPTDRVTFIDTEVRNIGIGNNPEKAIFYVGGISDLHIDLLKSQKVAADVEYFIGNDKYQEEKIVYAKNMKLSGGMLSRYCTIIGENIVHNTQEYCLGNLYEGSSFKNCEFSGQYITQNSPQIKYSNCTFNYTRQKFKNSKKAIELNSMDKSIKR